MRLTKLLHIRKSLRRAILALVMFLAISIASRSVTLPPEKGRFAQIDSLESLLSRCPTVEASFPILQKLAQMYRQQPETRLYYERLYQAAASVDSTAVVYKALKGLARYYYNSPDGRDSLVYYCDIIDSIAKARQEYPEALFEAKSFSSQDYLWRENYEMAMSEAMELYHLASEIEHKFGLVRCSESLGLIYQRIRKDNEAVLFFQEALDQMKEVRDFPNRLETQIRLTSYQAESSVRTEKYALTEKILERYKALIEEQDALNRKEGEYLAIEREYWLLYCLYTHFYLSLGDLGRAKESLDKASAYEGNELVEGDYVVNMYLAIKARYYKQAGNIPLALQCIDQVLATERLPEDIQFKAEILKEQGQLEEVVGLYDELYKTMLRKRNTAFLRQVNQLRTLHELHEKELRESELKETGQRIARKQDLLILILFVSSVLLILLYVLYSYYRHLRSLKNELQCEKDLLLESRQRLIKEKEKAEEASRMKSAFLANMSHEIRTPLNAIVGFSGLLVDPSTAPSERKEYSTIIHNNTDLMLNLVNDVLDLSRMETGDLYFDMKPHALIECCQMALESVRHRVPDGVELTFTPDPLPIVVCVDNLRLQQLLTNLLINATKFTERGEINLSFRLEPNRRMVRIAVTDTGTGIPPEKRDAVFKRFEKLDDYKAGAGLGLSISLLIAERLGGQFFIDPSYTAGARFVLILPCETPS